jgi:hypothetical protein
MTGSETVALSVAAFTALIVTLATLARWYIFR